MKLFIELPTWLGDAVMATPAIDNIVAAHSNAHITIFGSPVAVAVFKDHPRIDRIIEDHSRNTRCRWFFLCKTAIKLGAYDIALSFRQSLTSRFFIQCIRSRCKKNYRQDKKKSLHRVMRYNNFVNRALKTNTPPGRLKIHTKEKPDAFDRPTVGINPGASYGSAKRWYPEKFSAVAVDLSKEYDVMIFGGAEDIAMAHDIEKELVRHNVTNYQNLAGRTSIKRLIDKMSRLDLLITGDSGPMHVAAALSVPTVALFGPTSHQETSQWMHPKSVIVKKNLDCQPCMQRACPLKHHNCMKLIAPGEVLEACRRLLQASAEDSQSA